MLFLVFEDFKVRIGSGGVIVNVLFVVIEYFSVKVGFEVIIYYLIL